MSWVDIHFANLYRRKRRINVPICASHTVRSDPRDYSSHTTGPLLFVSLISIGFRHKKYTMALMVCTAILIRIAVRTISVIVIGMWNISSVCASDSTRDVVMALVYSILASEHITRRLFHIRFFITRHRPSNTTELLCCSDYTTWIESWCLMLNSGLQKVVSEHVRASNDKYLHSSGYCWATITYVEIMRYEH